MKSNAAKGGALSGLVFPGAGQIALKYYIRGIGFILITLAGLILMGIPVVQTLIAVLDQLGTLQDGDELERIVNTMDLVRIGLSSPALLWGIIILTASWIAATADAYLLGKRMDQKNDENNTLP